MRIDECLPLSCPRCGAEMRLRAFLTEPASLKPILRYAVLLRLDVRGRPSLACPFAGTKVHRTFVCLRLTLAPLGLPREPPRVAPARDPPLDDLDQTPAFDPTDPAPVPEYEFDHTVSW